MKLKKKRRILFVCLIVCLAILWAVRTFINPFHTFFGGSGDRPLKLGVLMSRGKGRIAMQVKEGMEDAADKYGDSLDMLISDIPHDPEEYDGMILDSSMLREKIPDHIQTIVLDEVTEDAFDWEEAAEFLHSLQKGPVAYIVDGEDESVLFAGLLREEDHTVAYGNEEEAAQGDIAAFFCLSDKATEWIVTCKEKGLVAGEIPVVGVALPEHAVAMLEESVLDAAIVIDYYAMGYETVQAMHSKEPIRIRRRLITSDGIYKSENISLLFPFLY